MLAFQTVSLDDQGWMSDYYRRYDFQGAQYSFAANYVWRLAYHIAACHTQDIMFVSFHGPDEPEYFRCPMSFDGDAGLRRGMELLMAYCKETGVACRLGAVSERDLDALRRIFPEERLEITQPRELAEYLYDRQTLVDLPGKKLHAKRTWLRHFLETDWSYQPLTRELIPQCLEMHHAWCKENNCKGDPERCAESRATKEAFGAFEQLGLTGGVLFSNGQVVAYTMGEMVGEKTFAVHFEKAFSQVPGAYPAINQMFCQNGMGDAVTVNREEDTGAEGLRKAKLSYQPKALLPLYHVTVTLDKI